MLSDESREIHSRRRLNLLRKLLEEIHRTGSLSRAARKLKRSPAWGNKLLRLYGIRRDNSRWIDSAGNVVIGRSGVNPDIDWSGKGELRE